MDIEHGDMETLLKSKGLRLFNKIVVPNPKYDHEKFFLNGNKNETIGGILMWGKYPQTVWRDTPQTMWDNTSYSFIKWHSKERVKFEIGPTSG